MPKSKEIMFGDYFKLPNPGLRSYFDRVREGQPEEYRTTFAKGDSVQKVLKDWEPTLKTISDKWPTLLEFENDLREKVGPLSIMKPLSERWDDIGHYYNDIFLDAVNIKDSAIKAVLNEYSRVRGIHPRSQAKVVKLMKKSTNSGSPYFIKRRLALKDTCPVLGVSPMDGTVLQMLKDGLEVYYACAVLGWRGQEGGPTDDDVKQRIVWMFPLGVNIKELQVYQPLIEACQTFNLVPAWVSMDSVDKEITLLFDTKGKDDPIVCTDFTKFDQHFNSRLQYAGQRILEGLLDCSYESRDWLDRVYPIKFMIPLAYDYDCIKRGKHGMASGSGGTNADETLVHRALQYEAAQNAHSRLNPHSMCLGDDGIICYPGITVDDVLQSYTRHGLEMNADKQYVSTQDCVYLRRWHHTLYRVEGICVGVYSTYRALGRLCEQERYYDPEVWSEKMVALRQLSIIENVKYHPLRDEFAEFCMKRDKYRLGIDIPGFLDNIQTIAKESIDLLPDFMGYTKSLQKDAAMGIKSWWIVKYLKSHS